jgi:hypothetical protein
MLFDALRCFVMHLWCCLGPGRILIVLSILLFENAGN